MRTSKKPLLELEAYCDEIEWDDFLLALGTLIKERFTTGFVKCSAEDIGWRHLRGYKAFECNPDPNEWTVARSFLFSFMPNCDYSARVYSLNSGRGLYINVTHHDNPVSGDRYYLTPISQRTYARLS